MDEIWQIGSGNQLAVVGLGSKRARIDVFFLYPTIIQGFSLLLSQKKPVTVPYWTARGKNMGPPNFVSWQNQAILSMSLSHTRILLLQSPVHSLASEFLAAFGR